MHIIRPIEARDDYFLSQLAGMASPGIFNLPRDPIRLKQKLNKSLESFGTQKLPFDGGNYFFVLENLESGAIEGCCAIHFDAGIPGEEYYFKIKNVIHPNRPIEQIPKEQKILVPEATPIENTSEIGSLFLSPICQKKGMGRLLSLSRFLFIACHRERFQKNLIAELRGVIEPSGLSPFWDAVGSHFCNISFEEFIPLFKTKILRAKDVIPHFPLYYSLLPPSAQVVVGQAHPQTQPALKMLEKEGFLLLDGVDLFDAGPKVTAEIANLRTVKTSQQAPIRAIISADIPQESQRPHLISTININFRACYGEIKLLENDHGVLIDQQAAEALQVSLGETICFAKAKA